MTVLFVSDRDVVSIPPFIQRRILYSLRQSVRDIDCADRSLLSSHGIKELDNRHDEIKVIVDMLSRLPRR